MARRVYVLLAVVGIALVVLGAGTGAGDDSGDEHLQTDGSSNATLLDAATDRVGEIFPGTDVEFGLANGSGLDVSISTPELGVAFQNLGTTEESTTAAVTSDAITEGIETGSDAGFCAVGLDGEDSPLAMDVDGESGSVSVAFGDYDPDASESDDEPFDPSAIVQGCSTWDDE